MQNKPKVVQITHNLGIGGVETYIESIIDYSCESDQFVIATDSGGIIADKMKAQIGRKIFIGDGTEEKLLCILKEIQPEIAHIHYGGNKESWIIDVVARCGIKIIAHRHSVCEWNNKVNKWLSITNEQGCETISPFPNIKKLRLMDINDCLLPIGSGRKNIGMIARKEKTGSNNRLYELAHLCPEYNFYFVGVEENKNISSNCFEIKKTYYNGSVYKQLDGFLYNYDGESDGFPVVLLEALAMGKIVFVDSGIGFISGILRDSINCIKIDCNNIPSQKNVINNIFSQDDFIRDIIQNGYSLIDSYFNPEAIVSKIEDIYMEILNG